MQAANVIPRPILRQVEVLSVVVISRVGLSTVSMVLLQARRRPLWLVDAVLKATAAAVTMIPMRSVVGALDMRKLRLGLLMASMALLLAAVMNRVELLTASTALLLGRRLQR